MRNFLILLFSIFFLSAQLPEIGAAADSQGKTGAVAVQSQQSQGQTIQAQIGTQLTNIRYGDGSARLRIVLDMTGAPKYSVVKENNDTRLVVNMDGITTGLQQAPALNSHAIKDIILGAYGGDTLQLIVDMKAPLATNVYMLKNPQRLVIDIQKEYESETVREVAAGLNLTTYVRLDSRGMLTAYALEADRSKFDLQLALAGGDISSGRRTVQNIAKTNQAVAAVNGGYFSLDGSLIGNTRINGETAGTTYYTRTSLGIMADGSLQLAESEYYGEVNVAGKKVYLSGVNCPRGENTTILYNDLFGSTTGTNEYGKEYVIQEGKVTAINQANSKIPAGGQVISVHGTAQNAFAKVKVGDKITIGESFGQAFEGADTVIGAGPELLQKGQVHVTATQEQFPSDIAKGRAPRTAMGIKADGNVILLVVDGRQSHSIGTTLTETAELLQKFGATEGFNLDGGGSSEMVVQGSVINSPSDGSQRPVGSAVLLVRK